MEKWVAPRPWGSSGLRTGLVLSILVQLLFVGAVCAQPSFNKSFVPSTIGPGSVSVLTYTISNGAGTGVRDLAFTDSLPAAITLATSANASSDCSGSLSAPSGGSSISLSNGELGSSSSCTISVNVTSSTAGTHTSTSGDLTSDAGNSGSASADLTVDAGRPGFSKSFSPSTVAFGGRSTLTFVIDNSANSSQIVNVSFSDTLPTGMTLANPVNGSTTCTGGTITGSPGGSVVSYSPLTPGLDSLPAGSSCSVSVDVIGGSTGELNNVSDELTATSGFNFVSCGKASATLAVIVERLSLIKSFLGDPVGAGDEVDLEFTITNLDRRSQATDITFTDDLDAMLSGLVATSLPSTPCGPGSSLTGTSVLTLAGGSLAAEASCTFSATLQVPAGAASGSHLNTTSTITGTADGLGIAGSPATDVLVVNAAPLLTKTFLTDPVGSGEILTMEFTITNTSTTLAASDIAFSDNINAFMSGTTISALPANGFCGGGSTIFSTQSFGDTVLVISGGNLAAAASCTFTVDLQVPLGVPAGPYLNTTSTITATIDGESAEGAAATAEVDVAGAPILSKSFIDDPTLPGDLATLRFELLVSEESEVGVTDITFTDDLDSALSGLVATDTPLSDVCGTGSQLTGTSTLSFTGGSLPGGGSCSFDVTVEVPASALPGSYTNQTSNVVADAGGVTVTGAAASDDLQVAGLSFSKAFVDDPVIAGGVVELEFTIDNSGTTAATGMFFTDSLSNVISGMSASNLPAEPCGAGSSITGTSFLIFQNGNLAAGTSCTFSVDATVPASAESTVYSNTTSSLSATVGGGQVVLDPATANLEVSSDLLGLAKEFTNDPVRPGDNVTLEFTVTNLADEAVSDLAFTDDLDAAMSGLASVSGTVNDICGSGSSISGTGLLTFSGGSLAAGASCTFSVNLLVPASALVGTSAENITSEVTGLVGGLSVFGGAASDFLELDALTFTKSFDTEVAVAGDTVELTFTLNNPSATETVSNINFADDLESMIPGLVATGLPVSDVCGEGSLLDGTSLVNLSDGSLMPGGSCSFTVTLQIPGDTLAGDYTNVTSEATDNGARLAGAATDTLTVNEAVCSVVDDFDDGVVDPGWTLVGVGNANQQSILETDGHMELTADGATAFYGADNAGFLYREVTGDFRVEVTIDGNPMTTGGLYQKAGLMIRASLDKWDIRLIAQLAPYWEHRDETHLQFVARESYGTPGRLPVARDVVGVPRIVRLAVERTGQRLTVEYSTDGGVTWILPTTGLGGSIDIEGLPETLLVGMDMVSNNISVTSTAYFDDFQICTPSE